MDSKPSTMELKPLTPIKKTSSGDASLGGAGIPLTPTIRLSEPPAPHHVDYHELARTQGIANPAFVGDQEPLFSKSFKERANGEVILSSHESAPEDNGSVFSGSNVGSVSLDQNSSLGSDVTNGNYLNGTARIRHNTMSLTDMLMPPNFNPTQKRHSLPTNGVVSLSASPDGQALCTENGSNSLLGSSCASIMSQMPSVTVKGLSSPWRKWFQRKSSAGSVISSVSDGSLNSNSFDPDNLSVQSNQRLQNLVKSVARSVRKNNKIGPAPEGSRNLLAPPLPPAGKSDPDKGSGHIRKRLDSFAPSSILDQNDMNRLRGLTMKKFAWRSLRPHAIDPTGTFWLAWLFIVSVAFIYNAVVISLRGIFSYVQGGNDTMPIIAGTPDVHVTWLAFDYFCDFIYIVDMYIRAHLSFFLAGQLCKDLSLTRKKYLHSRTFVYDVLSLLPLELFYILVGGVQPLFRIPRLLKVHVYMEFSSKFENKIRMAFIFRTVRVVGYLLYMIHLNTCAYYGMARIYGVNNTAWLYDGEGDPYVRNLYRATKTLITIGNLPAPTNNPEIIFMTIDFMIGIFVFATIIGQMRDIVGSAGATKENFRKRMDGTMTILKNRKIPTNVQKRVKLWFVNRLDKGELLDEQKLLQAIPVKMQTDMAIHVHMDTLSKVNLFQDCDKMLLRELVLQLRPVLYLPGDYICKKGEVGKEMYIIKNGQVQVLGGGDSKKVLATLHAGSVFGEISLLSLGAGNRRTADVYSPGYADLFVLDKKVLHEVIVSYPDAQEILQKKARELLKQNDASNGTKKKKRGKSLIAESILTKNSTNTPSKFFQAVLEVARSKHISATILKGSFDKSLEEEGEQPFAHYSSSDISGDEFIPAPRRSFRKKRKLQRSSNISPSFSNRDSGSDRRSDVDLQEPTIIVHPSPRENPPGTSNGTNRIRQDDHAIQLKLPGTVPYGEQTEHNEKKTIQDGETSGAGTSVDPEMSGAGVEDSSAGQEGDKKDGRRGRRKVGLASLAGHHVISQDSAAAENLDDSDYDPGDFHFSKEILRASPTIFFSKMESCEEVRSEQKTEGNAWPSLPQRPSVLQAGSDTKKKISFEEYKAVHSAYDIVDLDAPSDREEKQKKKQRSSQTRNTSEESLIAEGTSKEKQRKTSSPKKKHRKNKSGNKSKKGK